MVYNTPLLLRLSIYLSIVSEALFPLETSLNGWSKQMNIHLSVSTHSINTSFMHVFLYPILPSYNWPVSPRTLNFFHIHFLHKLFTVLSLKMTKPHKVFIFPQFSADPIELQSDSPCPLFPVPLVSHLHKRAAAASPLKTTSTTTYITLLHLKLLHSLQIKN